MKAFLVLLVAMLITSCTDVESANSVYYSKESSVVCYSGGKVVLQDTAIGRVRIAHSVTQFESKSTGRYMMSTADCVISTGE